MEITLQKIAAALKAEIVRGDAEKIISGVGNLLDSTPQHIAPFVDKQYLPDLRQTRAGVVLAGRRTDNSEVPETSALLVSDDPEIALISALHLFYVPEQLRAGVHSSAQVDPTARLAEGVHVGPNAVIEAHATIGARCQILASAVIGARSVLGDDCVIHRSVTLYPGTMVGRRVVIHSGSVLGADGFGYKFRGGKHIKVPHVGWVEIGDDVEIGANSCIDRGSLGPTRIGDGTKIDNLVQIAHNNLVGKHCIICGQVALAGSCTLEDYVVLGGNVGLADHTKMQRGSKAGAKSGVTGTIPAGAEVWGLFAMESRAAFKSQAAYRRLPELEKRVKQLEKLLQDAKSTV